MAVSNQLTNVSCISFGVVLCVAFISLFSATFVITRSRDILGAEDLRSASSRTEGRDGKVKARCMTAREAEVDQVIRGMETKERSKAFEKIFAEDYWGGGESRSGPGSRRDYTKNVRKLIGFALKNYGVQELLDAPCGEFYHDAQILNFVNEFPRDLYKEYREARD